LKKLSLLPKEEKEGNEILLKVEAEDLLFKLKDMLPLEPPAPPAPPFALALL